MLRPLQEYGLVQTIESDERERFRQAHAEYYVDLVERAEPNLVGPKQLDWLTRLDEEIENLRSAMEWAVESKDAPTGLRIAAALRQYWQDHHGTREARKRIEALLPLTGRLSEL